MNIYTRKFRTNLTIVFFVAIFFIVLIFIMRNIYEKEQQESMHLQHKILAKIANSSIKSIGAQYIIALDHIVYDKDLLEAFKDNNREEFRQLIEPIFTNLKTDNKFVNILTFRTADGKTFYRAHKPEFFGDFVSKNRRLISDALNNRQSLFGFEVGKLAIAYRVAKQIVIDGKVAGTVEIGVNPEYLEKHLNEILPSINVGLLLKANKKNISQYTIYEDGDFFKSFMHFNKLNDIKDTLYNVNNKSYLIESDVHLLNHKREQIGTVLLAWDISESINRYSELKLKVSILILIVGSMAFYLVNYTLKKFISLIEDSNKRLNELNGSLEEKVSLKTEELITLNKTLEERVAKEVGDNRQKDIQLIEQSRLAQMGEMLSMIAHQWRQPLAAISSAANSMGVKIALDKYKKEFFEDKISNIVNYSTHLSQTIDDFRKFTLCDTKLKENSTLEEIVNSSLTIVKDALKSRGISLQTEYSCNEQVFTYANELKQVVLNFIKNAEDVLRENSVESPTIFIKTYKTDSAYFLSVSDNGGGIKKSVLPKIFDPYFSTKDKKSGTGLGLYMSKTIVEEHCGWKLNAYNSDDGAVFEIEASLGI